jgi:hypothetical protein
MLLPFFFRIIISASGIAYIAKLNEAWCQDLKMIFAEIHSEVANAFHIANVPSQEQP